MADPSPSVHPLPSGRRRRPPPPPRRGRGGSGPGLWRHRPASDDRPLDLCPPDGIPTSLPPPQRSFVDNHARHNPALSAEPLHLRTEELQNQNVASQDARRIDHQNADPRSRPDSRVCEIIPYRQTNAHELPGAVQGMVERSENNLNRRDHDRRPRRQRNMNNPSQDIRRLESQDARVQIPIDRNLNNQPTGADGQRRQWRPSSQVNRLSSDPSDRQQDAVNVRSGMTSSEALELSRGAVEEVLQSLPLQREQGRYNPKGRSRRGGDKTRDAKGMYIRRHGEPAVLSNANKNLLKDKSNIPLLVQELEEKLSRGQVECMICFDIVKRESAVWSCGACYSMFHIACVRKWARAPNSADISLSQTNQATVGNWRCPGCQSPQFIAADELRYKCFCGQVTEPQVDYYITPHSCGGPCKKPLNLGKNPYCEHTCTMQCHPGPCPPCNALASAQFCYCGKTSYTQRCSEQRVMKSCMQPCGRQLQCGRHYCARICHEGSCGNCDALLTVKCFCGRKTETTTCSKMDMQGDLDWEVGVFSCDKPCPNYLQCGRHICNKKCHPGQCADCGLAPEKVKTCPCGKVPMQDLTGFGKYRKLCTDPIPCCGQPCNKLLSCGDHHCRSICHVGDCPPCEVLVDQKCRCKSSSQMMPCYKSAAYREAPNSVNTGESDEQLFLCNRKCGKKKNCGRHRCNTKCCPLTNDDYALPLGEDDPHICSLSCGKKLRCGQHVCQELCHNGHCPSCLESTFTELSCACGQTSILPPVPCGTPPPSCPHPCSVPQPCGHPATHSCHYGECPPCIVPTAKECVGKHVILRNVPCGSRDIKCNKLCGRPRQCGMHACGRTCHLPPCDVLSDDGNGRNKSCGQECGAPRRDCQHVCVAPCHPSAPCPETRCKFPVTISCACGRLSQQVPCDAGESIKGSEPIELAYFANLHLQPVDLKVRMPLGQRKLACDEECAKMEKKRVLADAFGITPAPIDPAISAESVQAGSEALKDLIRKEPEWVVAVEERFKYLVLGSKSPNAGPIRVHVFCFLTKERREVVRQIAERWNLAVSAVGREPRRFLTVHVNAKSRAPPMRSLIGRSALPLPGQAQASVFNPVLDMDPRLVVGLFDLPRDADISTLVLRFGGECELVWLTDKNALAVFSDIARAATAMRRVDHASAYSGAVRAFLPTSGSTSHGWGSAETGVTIKGSARRRNIQESSWCEDAWGEESRSMQPKTVWNGRSAPITTSQNPWGALEQAETRVEKSPLPLDKPSSSSTASSIQHSSFPSTLINAADDWEDLDD